MRKLIITGITGFVGQNLNNYLKEGFEVIGVSRMLNKENNFISYQEINNRYLNEFDAFIHLAGKAHDLKNVSNKNEYYEVNTELTKKIFDSFLISNSSVFIMLSSVKAVADSAQKILSENVTPNPKTHYGKSKLLAEKYILSKKIPKNKKVYILRPCMIHGPNNKGNLNLLYNFVSKKIPWPLGSFENKRSFCSIDNLIFIISELIQREDIPSGIYNVADDDPLSTNELVKLIAKSKNIKLRIINIPKTFIILLTKIGDFFHLPINSERLQKLTQSFVVNNNKIKNILGKELPYSSKQGLLRTLKSFNEKPL